MCFVLDAGNYLRNSYFLLSCCFNCWVVVIVDKDKLSAKKECHQSAEVGADWIYLIKLKFRIYLFV